MDNDLTFGPVDDVEIHPKDLLSIVSATLGNVRGMAKKHPSRELSLAVTNIEQGLLWLAKAANVNPAVADQF